MQNTPSAILKHFRPKLCYAQTVMAKSPDWGHLIALGLLGLLSAAVLASIAQDPKVSPQFRLIAQTAEGTLVQHLETGLIHLLV